MKLSKLDFSDSGLSSKQIMETSYDVFDNCGFGPLLNRDTFVSRVPNEAKSVALSGIFSPWEYRETEESMSQDLIQELSKKFGIVGYIITYTKDGVEVFRVDSSGIKEIEKEDARHEPGRTVWATIR